MNALNTGLTPPSIDTKAAGTASPAAIREARGLPPLARDRSVHHPAPRQPEHPPAGSAAGPQHPQLPTAGVQPGAVSPESGDANPVAHAAYAADQFRGRSRIFRESVRRSARHRALRRPGQLRWASIRPGPARTGPTFRLHACRPPARPETRITADTPSACARARQHPRQELRGKHRTSPGTRFVRRVHSAKRNPRRDDGRNESDPSHLGDSTFAGTSRARHRVGHPIQSSQPAAQAARATSGKSPSLKDAQKADQPLGAKTRDRSLA